MVAIAAFTRRSISMSTSMRMSRLSSPAFFWKHRCFCCRSTLLVIMMIIIAIIRLDGRVRSLSNTRTVQAFWLAMPILPTCVKLRSWWVWGSHLNLAITTHQRNLGAGLDAELVHAPGMNVFFFQHPNGPSIPCLWCMVPWTTHELMGVDERWWTAGTHVLLSDHTRQ